MVELWNWFCFEKGALGTESTQYVLASQKAFEAAQTQAFDELEYDECTEDQCFALIQQILQVDNLFLFNMTREGNFTQLSLTQDTLKQTHYLWMPQMGNLDFPIYHPPSAQAQSQAYPVQTETETLVPILVVQTQIWVLMKCSAKLFRTLTAPFHCLNKFPELVNLRV